MLALMTTATYATYKSTMLPDSRMVRWPSCSTTMSRMTARVKKRVSRRKAKRGTWNGRIRAIEPTMTDMTIY
jgi:hypothetical protein